APEPTLDESWASDTCYLPCSTSTDTGDNGYTNDDFVDFTDDEDPEFPQEPVYPDVPDEYPPPYFVPAWGYPDQAQPEEVPPDLPPGWGPYDPEPEDPYMVAGAAPKPPPPPAGDIILHDHFLGILPGSQFLKVVRYDGSNLGVDDKAGLIKLFYDMLFPV